MDKDKGLCFGHPDPDLWFPEMAQGPVGLPTSPKILLLAERIKRALDICDACPVKPTCKLNGMREENLAYGIWGGEMAGERLAYSGAMLSDFSHESEEAKAIRLTVRMYPFVRWD